MRSARLAAPHAALPILAILALFCPANGAAQDTAPAGLDAGDVATIVLQIPAPAGVDSADYTLHLEPGYRAFVPTRDRVARLDDVFILALTFATPTGLAAGSQVAGRLELRMDGGETRSRELVIRVRERREVLFHLDLDETTIPPDGVTRVPFRLYNPGNLADTVHVTASEASGWSLLDPPRIVLEPGDSAVGELRIAAPVSVSPGDRHLFVITAESLARQQSRTMSVVVVSAQGWLGGLAHVPSSLFIGQALGQGAAGTVAALTGAGRVGPDTEVRVDLRYAERGVLDPALQREMAGAGVRISVERPDLRLTAGDVYTPSSTLTGSFRQARGIDAEYDPAGPLSARAFVAVPSGLSGDLRDGHIVQGEAAMETSLGELGVLAGDMRQPGLGTLPASRSTGGGIQWKGERPGHSGSVQATVLRVAAGDTAISGPALQLDYRLERDRVTGRLAARRVPGAATTDGGRGNEISGAFSAEILPTLHVVGWGYGTDQARLGRDDRSESRAANVGLRGRVGRLQLQLAETLTHRRTTTAADSFTLRRHTVRADASYVRGPFSIQSEVEIGAASELGREGAFRAVGSSLRWYSASRSAWARVHHAERPGGLSTTNIQAGGSYEMGPVSLSGGLNRSASSGTVITSFWSLTEVDVQRNLAVHLGASARPSLDGQDWSFSIGLRRRLNLPLPLARQPDLYGVVFDDANDNGVRDPGERPVQGVSLALGYFETETDDDGGFGFRDATGMPLRIRGGGLPMGYVLRSDVVLPTRGRAAIPLVRTATLQLQLFLDRDEDGVRDAAESVGSGVSVVATDQEGRRRSTTADEDGIARLTGLVPGRYAITARPNDRRGGDVEPQVLMEVDLAPGGEVLHTLAVPLRRRTIRMGGDDGGVRF